VHPACASVHVRAGGSAVPKNWSSAASRDGSYVRPAIGHRPLWRRMAHPRKQLWAGHRAPLVRTSRSQSSRAPASDFHLAPFRSDRKFALANDNTPLVRRIFVSSWHRNGIAVGAVCRSNPRTDLDWSGCLGSLIAHVSSLTGLRSGRSYFARGGHPRWQPGISISQAFP
jgi:hypothetical protein